MSKLNYRSMLILCLLLAALAAGCGRINPAPVETAFPTGQRSTEPALSPTPLPPTATRATPSPAPPTGTPTRVPTATPTERPTQTATVTLTPTYSILRAQVLQRSNCRYGPGAPYLYKYGLVVGSNLELIGRNEAGTWLLVRAIGGDNPCWVKATLMEVKGEVMAVEPTYIPLPLSPYYGPPTGVWAIREGDEVTISWHAIQLRPGDETASPPYLVEAWTCIGGQIVFTPLGSYEPYVKVRDEAGCAQASQARVYIVEKHGYTLWVKVPWPGR